MPFFDLSPAELEEYRPAVRTPADFDEFWTRTLADHSPDGDVVLEPYAAGLSLVDVWDMTFPGFDANPIKAWLIVPAGADEPLPGVVEFVGYGGGRGLPHEHLRWPSAGYAYLIMDTRGQGSAWGAGGGTADPQGSGFSYPGFMTRGIDSQETYYYRRVFTDAVRAVAAFRALPHVDATRVAVTGNSQGGGIAIAAAGLVPGLLGVMPNVPFLCHFGRAVGLTGLDPYEEIVRYLAVHREAEDRVFETLSYFDGVSFAARTTAPALFSTALQDMTCPPSTVFAARNNWAGGEAEMEIYRYNHHEGGDQLHWAKQAAWLAARLG